MERDIKICFLALNSYPVFKEDRSSYIGGSAIQQVELANELVGRGYDVYFITYGGENEVINGIKLIKTYNQNKINKLSDFKKFYLIWKKLKDVDADVYIYRSGSPIVGSLFCYLKGKKLVRQITSDANVTGEPNNKKTFFKLIRYKIGNWIDLKFANLIVSQSKWQKKKLKENFNKNSVIIKNAFKLPNINESAPNKKSLLWVGNIRSVKRPFLFLNIAKKLSDYKFIMIGGRFSEEPHLYDKIRKKSKKIPNLHFKGYVPHSDIFEYYKKASVLIHTSKTEGFPNVFLEAWMHYIPVISLSVDPDKIISRLKLGFCSKDLERMIQDVDFLLNNESVRKKMGKNCRKYVEKNHDIKKITDKYEKIITRLINDIS